MTENTQLATLAGGCFWCTEAVFRRLRGVISAMPGYSGGTVANPTYMQVAARTTGHAEVVQIEFDPSIISFEKLLEVFWTVHDPTTLNRQGADAGPEYRSAIFYHDEQQKTAAEQSIKDLAASGKYKDPIVTELAPFTKFYPASEEHREFYEKNRSSGYCRFVIDPKVQKLYKDFKGDLKQDA